MYEWLDKIIADQAEHYGLTRAKHAELVNGAAEYQEQIEHGTEEEPK